MQKKMHIYSKETTVDFNNNQENTIKEVFIDSRNQEIEELERNGSLVYIEDKDGNRDWVDYRDVDGWFN